MWRWQHLLSRLVLPTGTKGSLLSRLPDPGQKDPLLSRPGVPGWETGTTRVSQPGQISVSVVVIHSQKYSFSDLIFFPFLPFCVFFLFWEE